MQISVVVLTFNRRDSVRDLLEHLHGIRSEVLEIIVVDNAGDDGTAAMVREEYPWVRCIRNEENLGACGRSRGIEAATGEIVITLDDDVFGLGAGDLRFVEGAFGDAPRLAVLNFRVVDHTTGEVCNWVHHCPPDRAGDAFPTYEITEGAVAIRREAYLEVGGYWNEFFIGHEGPDLAFRLLDAGWDVRYDGRIVLRHKHEQTARVSWRFYYYDTRNQLLLAMRRMPPSMALRYLTVGLGAMFVYSVRDRQLRHWFRGVIDGVRLLPRAKATRGVMGEETRRMVREIDRERPSFWTMARKRLFGGANRLDG